MTKKNVLWICQQPLTGVLFIYIFFLSGFSFTDIDKSQDCRGRHFFNSSLPLSPVSHTQTISGRLLQRAHLCTQLAAGLEPATFDFRAQVAKNFQTGFRLAAFKPVESTSIYTIQFARIHTSLLINTEKILNRPITKFYKSDDVNVIAAELRLTKTRPISFYMKHNFS